MVLVQRRWRFVTARRRRRGPQSARLRSPGHRRLDGVGFGAHDPAEQVGAPGSVLVAEVLEGRPVARAPIVDAANRERVPGLYLQPVGLVGAVGLVGQPDVAEGCPSA